jgi:hypothetical protein
VACVCPIHPPPPAGPQGRLADTGTSRGPVTPCPRVVLSVASVDSLGRTSCHRLVTIGVDGQGSLYDRGGQQPRRHASDLYDVVAARASTRFGCAAQTVDRANALEGRVLRCGPRRAGHCRRASLGGNYRGLLPEPTVSVWRLSRPSNRFNSLLAIPNVTELRTPRSRTHRKWRRASSRRPPMADRRPT